MLLFESFNDIKSICEKYDIINYTINTDGSIDVDDDVDLYGKYLFRFPLKFGRVTGDFDCTNNQLTTLEGSPKEVGGDFSCSTNRLTILDGGPREVGGSFYCNHNQLITLEGGPREVGGRFFSCGDNPIYQVYKLFPNYKSYIDSLDYNYLRGENIVKSRFKEALDEIGKEVPKSINGYKYIL
jgi:hypothetical protein